MKSPFGAGRIRAWLDRDLWAMDLFHWSLRLCSPSFYSQFLDYVIEVGQSRKRTKDAHS